MKNITYKQAEQLIILTEECSEVQSAATKLLRFGNQKEYHNLDKLVREMGDLLGIMDWIVSEFDINPSDLLKYAELKQEKMKKWTSYQNEHIRS